MQVGCILLLQGFERRSKSHVFIAMLVDGKMDCAERAPTQLLFDLILIDPMYSSTVVFAVRIFRASMESFLDLAGRRGFSTMVPQRALVGWCRPAHVV